MGFNGHFKNNAFNSVRWASLVSRTSKRKMEEKYSMAVGKGELVQERLPKHSGMGTSRMKTDENRRTKVRTGVSLEIRRARKKEIPTACITI